MIMDSEMSNYMAALRDAKNELAGMESRRRALRATVEVLSGLLRDDEQLPLADVGDEKASDGKAPTIPLNYFKGKMPTQAYRDLLVLAPGEYTAPEVVDAFQDGGMEGRSRTQLLQAVHSVMKRDRDKLKAQGDDKSPLVIENLHRTVRPEG